MKVKKIFVQIDTFNFDCHKLDFLYHTYDNHTFIYIKYDLMS